MEIIFKNNNGSLMEINTSLIVHQVGACTTGLPFYDCLQFFLTPLEPHTQATTSNL